MLDLITFELYARMQLISSPLQGFTDFRFRNAFQRHFGGIDTFYAPYIRLNGKLEIKSVYERDIALKNNTTITVIPQIMTNDPDEFLFVAKYVRSLGYTELNWNLGCPYPMVVNRCMGSGLINDPQRIDRVLDRAHAESDIVVSMKMRMGYEEPTEIQAVFPILEKYPIKSIAIHARIGKQLYKGGTNLEAFENCLNKCSHPIYFNGDITSVHDFQNLQERFPSIDTWLIGRGLIADPFLPQMIKSNKTDYPSDKLERFKKFHDELLEQFELQLSGDKHVIQKMSSYWEYFELKMENEHRQIKRIKKSKNLDTYRREVENLCEV